MILLHYIPLFFITIMNFWFVKFLTFYIHNLFNVLELLLKFPLEDLIIDHLKCSDLHYI